MCHLGDITGLEQHKDRRICPVQKTTSDLGSLLDVADFEGFAVENLYQLSYRGSHCLTSIRIAL